MASIKLIPANISSKLPPIYYKSERFHQAGYIYPSRGKNIRDSKPKKTSYTYGVRVKMYLPSKYLISKKKNLSRDIKTEIVKDISHRFVQKYSLDSLSNEKYLNEMDIHQNIIRNNVSISVSNWRGPLIYTRLYIKILPNNSYLYYFNKINIEELIVSAIFRYIDAAWTIAERIAITDDNQELEKIQATA